MATAADTAKMRQACSVFLQAGARDERQALYDLIAELRGQLAEQEVRIEEQARQLHSLRSYLVQSSMESYYE